MYTNIIKRINFLTKECHCQWVTSTYNNLKFGDADNGNIHYLVNWFKTTIYINKSIALNGTQYWFHEEPGATPNESIWVYEGELEKLNATELISLKTELLNIISN